MKENIEIKVRGYHIDYFGHVNNARYLEFLEEGRWDFFEKNTSLKGLRQKGLILLIVNINISYHRPARLRDLLDIRTSISKIGEKSVTMYQEIFLKETADLIADAYVTFVIANLATNHPVKIEGELRSAILSISHLEDMNP